MLLRNLEPYIYFNGIKYVPSRMTKKEAHAKGLKYRSVQVLSKRLRSARDASGAKYNPSEFLYVEEPETHEVQMTVNIKATKEVIAKVTADGKIMEITEVINTIKEKIMPSKD